MPTSALVNGLLGVLIFSASLPATKLAVEVFDPMGLTVARAVIAAIAAGLYLKLGRRPMPEGRDWVALSIAAAMLTLVFPLGMAFASVTLGAAHGAVIMGLLPLATAVAATAFARERPSPLFWLASAAGGALVVLFALRSSGAGGFGIALGDVILLVAVAGAAIGYAVSGRLSRSMSGLDVIAWAVVLATPVTATLTLMHLPGLVAAPAAPKHWLALLYLGLFSMFLGFYFWNKGLAQGGVAKVGQIQLLQTFFSIGLAALLLGEPVTPEMLVFATLVAVAVVVARRATVKRLD